MSFTDDYYNNGDSTLSSAATALSTFLQYGLQWFGLPIASAVLVVMDFMNYNSQKEAIAKEYRKEIAAKLKKPDGYVSIRDMETVAKGNPTIAEALKRRKTNRNVNAFENIFCTFLSFGAALAFAVPVLNVLAIGTTMAAVALSTAVIGSAVFFASSWIIDRISERVLNLKEPSIREVIRKPALQPKLSSPSQINYMEELQRIRMEIKPEQVIDVFTAAQPKLSVENITAKYDIDAITKDLNAGLIYPQELAFIVHDQESGVPRRDSAEVSFLRKTLQKTIVEDQKAIESVKEQAIDYVAENQAKMNEKLAAASAPKEDETNKWRDEVGKGKTPTPAEIAAQRTGKSAIDPASVAISKTSETTAASER